MHIQQFIQYLKSDSTEWPFENEVSIELSNSEEMEAILIHLIQYLQKKTQKKEPFKMGIYYLKNFDHLFTECEGYYNSRTPKNLKIIGYLSQVKILINEFIAEVAENKVEEFKMSEPGQLESDPSALAGQTESRLSGPGKADSPIPGETPLHEAVLHMLVDDFCKALKKKEGLEDQDALARDLKIFDLAPDMLQLPGQLQHAYENMWEKALEKGVQPPIPATDAYKRLRQFIRFRFLPSPYIVRKDAHESLIRFSYIVTKMEKAEKRLATSVAKKYNLTLKDISNRGNCFFDSVSDQLQIRYGIDISADHLRVIAMEQMRRYPTKYVDQFSAEEDFKFKHVNQPALDRIKVHIDLDEVKHVLIRAIAEKNRQWVENEIRDWTIEDIFKYCQVHHDSVSIAILTDIVFPSLTPAEKVEAHANVMLENVGIKEAGRSYADDIDVLAMSDALGISIISIRPQGATSAVIAPSSSNASSSSSSGSSSFSSISQSLSNASASNPNPVMPAQTETLQYYNQHNETQLSAPIVVAFTGGNHYQSLQGDYQTVLKQAKSTFPTQDDISNGFKIEEIKKFAAKPVQTLISEFGESCKFKEEKGEAARKGTLEVKQEPLKIELDLRRLMIASAELLKVGFGFGKAYSEGDSFYDSIMQTISNDKLPPEVQTASCFERIKWLRKQCKDYALSSDGDWLKKLPKGWKPPFDYEKYVNNVQYSVQDCNNRRPNSPVIWGSNIDAMILCKKLDIKIDVCFVDEKGVIQHYMWDKKEEIFGKTKQPSTISYKNSNIVHIHSSTTGFADRKHYTPVLKIPGASHLSQLTENSALSSESPPVRMKMPRASVNNNPSMQNVLSTSLVPEVLTPNISTWKESLKKIQLNQVYSLDLSDMRLTNHMFAELMEALKINSSLKLLDLSNHDFTYGKLQEILTVLKFKKNISLNLRGKQSFNTSVGRDELEDFFDDNETVPIYLDEILSQDKQKDSDEISRQEKLKDLLERAQFRRKITQQVCYDSDISEVKAVFEYRKTHPLSVDANLGSISVIDRGTGDPIIRVSKGNNSHSELEVLAQVVIEMKVAQADPDKKREVRDNEGEKWRRIINENDAKKREPQQLAFLERINNRSREPLTLYTERSPCIHCVRMLKKILNGQDKILYAIPPLTSIDKKIIKAALNEQKEEPKKETVVLKAQKKEPEEKGEKNISPFQEKVNEYSTALRNMRLQNARDQKEFTSASDFMEAEFTFKCPQELLDEERQMKEKRQMKEEGQIPLPNEVINKPAEVFSCKFPNRKILLTNRPETVVSPQTVVSPLSNLWRGGNPATFFSSSASTVAPIQSTSSSLSQTTSSRSESASSSAPHHTQPGGASGGK